MKELGIDRAIRRFFEKRASFIVMGVLFAISVLIRFHLAPVTDWSGDYLYCISPWTEEFRRLGPIDGLAASITNYYIPYNLVYVLASFMPTEAWVPFSLISCLFDYLLVYGCYRILMLIGEKTKEVRSERAVFVALMVLFLPPVVMNSALWKQCDAIYAAFAVLAVYFLLADRYYTAFIFLSIAFVFKLQAILVFPVFIIAYFCGKKYSVLYWLRIPLTYLEAGIPAILCGRDPAEVYAIYLNQSDEYHFMFMNTSGLYRLLRSDYDAMNRAGIFLVIAFLAVVFLYVYKRRAAMNDRLLFMLAGITSYACFLLLPAMHERYDYLPIVLVAVYYAYYKRERLYIPAVIVLVTSVMYCAYLFDGYFAGIRMPEEIYALLCLGMLYLMYRDFARELNERAAAGIVNNAASAGREPDQLRDGIADEDEGSEKESADVDQDQ